MRRLGLRSGRPALLANQAYEDDETRGLARQLSYQPVTPPHGRRARLWASDRQRFRDRNCIERLFRQLKRFLAYMSDTTSSMPSTSTPSTPR